MAPVWDSPGEKGQQTLPPDTPAVMPDAPDPRERPPALPEVPHPENSPARAEPFRAPSASDFPPVRGGRASANSEPRSHSQLSPLRHRCRHRSGSWRRIPARGCPDPKDLMELEHRQRGGEETQEDEKGLGGVRRPGGFWCREQKWGKCFWVPPVPRFRGSSSSQPISVTEDAQPLATCEEKCFERQICVAMRL